MRLGFKEMRRDAYYVMWTRLNIIGSAQAHSFAFSLVISNGFDNIYIFAWRAIICYLLLTYILFADDITRRHLTLTEVGFHILFALGWI